MSDIPDAAVEPIEVANAALQEEYKEEIKEPITAKEGDEQIP